MDEFVERIRDRGYHRDQIRFRRTTPGRDPEPRPCEMDAGIADRLAGRGIDELHAHQVDAIGASATGGTSWETLLRDRGCMARRDVHPNQVAGTVTAWARRYNVAFRFVETRRRAELCAFLLLVRHSLAGRLEER